MFAAAPYGVVGAVAALWIMGTPFGFMAFLGVASLIGVIVSHVIVLFDFIEEKHEEGEPFEEAVIDAGIIRLRPVMITVGATVLALFPLAHARRPTLAAALLHADRRPGGRDLHHAAAGAGAVRNLCAGSEDPEVGDQGKRPSGSRGSDGYRGAHSGNRVTDLEGMECRQICRSSQAEFMANRSERNSISDSEVSYKVHRQWRFGSPHFRFLPEIGEPGRRLGTLHRACNRHFELYAAQFAVAQFQHLQRRTIGLKPTLAVTK